MVDFAGSHYLYHVALANAIFRNFTRQVRVLPIGNPDGPNWLQAIQSQLLSETTALGIAPPADVASFDLSRPEDHASFFWILSQELTRIRDAAGLS